MALVFFGSPEFPVECALAIGRALKQHPAIKLRMGIHTGPVYRVADINANRNVAGGGINMAQRVMDCGDAGHILVSKVVADVLGEVSTWSNIVLHDLGEVEVKHGVRVHIYNLYTDDAGNPELPTKLQTARKAAASEHSTKVKRRKLLLAIVGAAIAIPGFLVWYRGHSRRVPSADAQRWYDMGIAALRDATYVKAARALQMAVTAITILH